MKLHTKDFLATLLFTSDDKFAFASVHDFSTNFVISVEFFIDGFYNYLVKNAPELIERINDCDNSFGGNIYFTLSGHGCGFWDDGDKELGKNLTNQLYSYSKDKRRFEQLDIYLDYDEQDKIDLGFIPKVLKEYRDKFFTV